MKKIVLFLALVGATMALAGVAAPAASAANCTWNQPTAVYSPHAGWNLVFSLQAYHCSNVSNVKYLRSSYHLAGMQDNATYGYALHDAQQSTDVVVSASWFCSPGCAFPYDYGTYQNTAYSYTLWCWYVGQVRTVRTYYNAAIFNTSTGTWGGATIRYGPWFNMAC